MLTLLGKSIPGILIIRPLPRLIFCQIFCLLILLPLLSLQTDAEVIFHKLGQFEIIQGKPGVVIGVPHGIADPYTDVIGYALALRTGAGAVIATRFCCRWTDHRRINVNRPTERAGVPPPLEALTDRATEIYELYRKLVHQAAQGPLGLYWEIHGNNRSESTGQIEVATVGVDRDLAREIKESYFSIRDTVLETETGVLKLDFKIEPLDQVHFSARSAKNWEVFQDAALVLQLELPKAVRFKKTPREAYIRILAEWMESVMRTVGKTRILQVQRSKPLENP
ncbi:MAG TPA: hypothetical protein VJM80_06315 [bacterium]|nr:hypothetical protein [bacterium]